VQLLLDAEESWLEADRQWLALGSSLRVEYLGVVVIVLLVQS
jgi:hypothetical protein